MTGEPATLDELTVQALLVEIVELERQLQAEREMCDHWRTRAQTADRRVADLETERFSAA